MTFNLYFSKGVVCIRYPPSQGSLHEEKHHEVSCEELQPRVFRHVECRSNLITSQVYLVQFFVAVTTFG